MPKTVSKPKQIGSLPSKEEIISDYKLAFVSRQASLIGRKEVLSGKAKFGIFGDGKEIAQIAMAKAFQKGDWRSGYYRDQTFMFAIGASDVKKFFAQLYADPNLQNEPSSGGRQMNAHFSTRFLDENGQWLNQLMMHNSFADASPTACQMSRLVGLGYASKLYRQNPDLTNLSQFSRKGNEVAFGTIGNASTAEGVFWESMNAAAVLGVPVVVSVWDDDYGISVPNEFQMAKQNISRIMAGFQIEKGTNGLNIYQVKGWDYPELIRVYGEAVSKARKDHQPALIHVYQLTQPQGHSTSGSHERYKSPERLEYEKSFDSLERMRAWMIEQNVSSSSSLEKLEEDALKEVERLKNAAWREFFGPIEKERDNLAGLYRNLANQVGQTEVVAQALGEITRAPGLSRRTLITNARLLYNKLRNESAEVLGPLTAFIKNYADENQERYGAHQHCHFSRSPLRTAAVPAQYSDKSEGMNGSDVIRACFDHHLGSDPRVFIIGEDVGQLGGVNLEFKDLQEKYGSLRVTDTGIREATILGQGLGAAVRGLKPIVDIQYLDYLLYAFQILSDDVASLHYRSHGGQIAPVIIRTKGHRLEGIWHTGSPIGMIIHGIRGVHLCVPRNMVQAAGMYNTLLEGDDPALVIEVLNGYRLKEVLPDNLPEFRVPLGQPDILKEGSDVTVVTYGACVRIVMEAVDQLAELGINVEVIDVQTLLPFDINHKIAKSIEKTGAVAFVDEDVPGGATAYMMQQVLEVQGGYSHLDSSPKTVAAAPHRSPYGSDGDYFSKPNAADVFKAIYSIMNERDPGTYPALELN
jgi:pyruvate/2-oxoglutarate/acetoin dehydrogenase E1 component/TPP-dependent pyruvate/acetoin dehydrogenase alpha subunit